MKPLSPADLQAFMQRHAIQGEIMFLAIPTPTVETAAQAIGAQPESIVKSILFMIKDQPVLVIACGTQQVERRAIAARYGVGRKQVKLAPSEVVLRVAGYEIGAMPPFGHLQPIPTLIDPHVLEQPLIYAGGGAENALLRLNPQDILHVASAEVIDLMDRSGESVN